ncbi:MAG: pyroglutamyl-peptidase I [Clostridia bacterium]|nr:pyroglutamyl-peptidase I [Clostridia bacterium]
MTEKTLSGPSELILVTAFEPFGGDSMNPSERVLARLPDIIGGFGIARRLLPVEFVRAVKLATEEYDRLSPAAVVMIGQAGGRESITPETTGKNVMFGRIPDNAGFAPDHIPVSQSGPDTLVTSFPIGKIVDALSGLGIPCRRSDDAGEYVCNAVYYGMLEHVGGRVPAVFIHIPYIPEQGHADRPSLPEDIILCGIEAAIATVAGEVKGQ